MIQANQVRMFLIASAILIAIASCDDETVTPLDPCPYPESLGGAGIAGQCGIHTGAWFPLGASDLSVWPARVSWASASGGGVSESLIDRRSVRLARDSADQPVVMWRDGALHVRHWTAIETSAETGTETGTETAMAWAALAPLSAPGDELHVDYDLAIDSAGNPLVLERYQQTLRLSRWNGSAWTPLGEEWPTKGSALQEAQSVELAIDRDDNPTVAWQAGSDVFLRTWTGTAWTDLAGSDTAGGVSDSALVSRSVALALDSAGNPVVAWKEHPDEVSFIRPPVFVKQWNGSSWQELAGSANGEGVSGPEGSNDGPGTTSIAFDRGDNLVVAWDRGGSVRMRTWDGAAWSDIAEVAVNSLSAGPRLTTDAAGKIYVYWNEYGTMHVAERTDAEISPRVSTALTDDHAPFAVVVGADGKIGLAHVAETVRRQNGTRPFELFYAEYHSGAWSELGVATVAGEALGAALSATHTLVQGADERVTVAWMTEDCQLRIQEWNDAAWTVLPIPSIVTERPFCTKPALAVSGSDLIVATLISTEDAATEAELRALRWNGSDWAILGEALDVDLDGYHYIGEISIALNSSNNPVIGWLHLNDEGGGLPRIKAWNGVQWVAFGADSLVSAGQDRRANEGTASLGLVLDDDDDPVVAWASYAGPNTYQRWVARWDGTAWIDVSDSTWTIEWDGKTWRAPNGVIYRDAYATRLTRAAGGALVHTWPTADSIDIREWTGSAWKRRQPSSEYLAELDPDARFYVWDDDASGQYEVYVAHYHDGRWRDLSASARGGGISHSGAASVNPAAASDGHRICVAYNEFGQSDSLLLLRCHE